MDSELRLLSDQVGKFIQAELAPHAARWQREHCIDRSAWRDAGAAGILCASIPTEYGGGGGTLAHELVVLQELDRAGLTDFSAGVSISSAIVAHYLFAYGGEDQKQRWLPRMASGEFIGAIAMTEPGAGSDLKNMGTLARVEGDGYRLSGQKTFITNGFHADLVVVAAKTTGSSASNAISLFVIETSDLEGFTRGKPMEKIGMHSQDTCELFFDDVYVPSSDRLGSNEGEGFSQLTKQLGWERLVCAQAALVGMERAVELTVAYTKERSAFGKKVADFQNTQFKLAECRTQAVVARAFFDSLVAQVLGGNLDPVTAAMAKWWITDAQSSVADQCLQLHGGYGYMAEYPIARLWTDARAMRIYAGTNEIMKLIIARSL